MSGRHRKSFNNLPSHLTDSSSTNSTKLIQYKIGKNTITIFVRLCKTRVFYTGTYSDVTVLADLRDEAHGLENLGEGLHVRRGVRQHCRQGR